MVMPLATAELCPQCGQSVRAPDARCRSCGFWLPAAPAPRTGPPPRRPAPLKDNSKRNAIIVLIAGGAVVATLLLIGVAVWMRNAAPVQASVVAAPPPPVPSVRTEPARLAPSTLLAEARRKAVRWHPDAVLVDVNVSRLDEHGVARDGAVEFHYARPAGQRISGGAETGPDGLVLTARAGELTEREVRSAKSRLAPEPNCVFEDAWAAAQRAGASGRADLRLRYQWSERHGRPVWEVLGPAGEVQRRLDGTSCSILTR